MNFSMLLHTAGGYTTINRKRDEGTADLSTHKLLLCVWSHLHKCQVSPQLQLSWNTVLQHLIFSKSFLTMAGHFHQTNLSGAMVTSPLAVDFRCFMTRQSPHIIYRQAGCLVRLQCQWGEPVKGHKWEEASIIDWVLVSGIEKKMWKWLSRLKVEACTEVLCWGSPLRLLERSRAFACQGWRKVNHTRSVWTVICMFFTEIWDQRKKKSSGAVYQSAYVQNIAVCPWGISSHPLPWPPATALTFSTSGSKYNKSCVSCVCL